MYHLWKRMYLLWKRNVAGPAWIARKVDNTYTPFGSTTLISTLMLGSDGPLTSAQQPKHMRTWMTGSWLAKGKACTAVSKMMLMLGDHSTNQVQLLY
jgi:hypothetical protein